VHQDWADVVIVGAGVAGLAAASALRRHHVEPLIIEAAARVGGRALTDTQSLGGVFDYGAGWLHASAKNPLVALASQIGLHVEQLSLRELVYCDGSGWLTPTELKGWDEFRDSAYAKIRRAASDGNDVPVSRVVDANGPYWRLLEGWFADDEGTHPDAASTADIAAYCDTGEHATVREGLGTLVRTYADGLPVHCGVRATHLDWSGPGIKLDTTHGSLRARAAIVTASTAVLSREDIAFAPTLPPRTLAAIGALPLSTYEKVGMRLKGPPLVDRPAWVLSLADDLSVALEVRPQHQPRVIAYLNGSQLAGQPPDALRTVAQDRLATTFGVNASAQVVAWRATRWSDNLLIGGSYSHALPGQAAARAVLAAPLDDRLFFAGEACSQTAYGTLHGAYLSGRVAGERVAQVLG
jgi:monoamine oxidase